ncbi:MAG TPA: response regulator [Verrucomicrobiae bacterium]|nr:response regulator [Verrucomicrobiae bacterium]
MKLTVIDYDAKAVTVRKSNGDRPRPYFRQLSRAIDDKPDDHQPAAYTSSDQLTAAKRDSLENKDFSSFKRGSSSSRRILLVDDDAETRTLIGFALTSEGYEVKHADNGKDAITLHNQQPFDLIITELILKEKDGFEIFAELNRKPHPTKFIATAKTSWTSAELSLNMAKKLGAHFTLTKPFKTEQLLETVRKALDQN